MAPLQVVVPPGVVPGQSLQIQVGAGMMLVQVPPGAVAGTVLHLQIDEPALAGGAALAPAAAPASAPLQQDGGGGGDGAEKIAIVIATIFGFFGVIIAIVMLNNLDLGGEGIVCAVVCLAAAAALGWKLRKNLRDRGAGPAPLTPSEDTAMAAVLILPHAAVFAIVIQVYAATLAVPIFSEDSSAWSGDLTADGVGAISGSRVLFAVGLGVHLLLAVPQALFLNSLGVRFPALAAETPRGGYVSWLSLTALPLVLLAIGFGIWKTLTCIDAFPAGCIDNDGKFPNGTYIGDLAGFGSGHNRQVCDYSAECKEDASLFTLIFGGLLLFAAAGLSQFSNHGWFAVWVLPVICMVLVIWSALWGASSTSHTWTIDRPSPLLLLPLLAVWVSGWALARCGQTAKWSEATCTMMSFSILLVQVIMTVANVNLGIVASDSEGFLTTTTSVLWLTQFIFVPVVLLDRTSFPILSLALGAGLLDTDYTLFATPIAAAVGLLVIKLTPAVPELELPLIVIQGFDLKKEAAGSAVQAAAERPAVEAAEPNRNRLLACAYLTPALAAGYIVSSWIAAIGGDEADARLSAIVVLAPALLGAGQMTMHKLSSHLAKAAVVASFMFTAGAWTDTTLAVIFTCLWVPVLLFNQCMATPVESAVLEQGTAPSTTWDTRWVIHAVCSATIFFMILFHRLNLNAVQPWLYVVGLYGFCWDPLSVTVQKMQAQPRGPTEQPRTLSAHNQMSVQPVQLTRCRLWRPGVLGPLACVVPATLWTIRDQKYSSLCDTRELEDGLCTNSALYQLFLLLPVVLILVEWSIDEVCLNRLQGAHVSAVASKQSSRTSALVLIGLSAVPFRLYLLISEHINIDYLQAKHLLDTGQIDNISEYHDWYSSTAEQHFLEWSEYLPLASYGSQTAGFLYTGVLASALILNSLICMILHTSSSVLVDADSSSRELNPSTTNSRELPLMRNTSEPEPEPEPELVQAEPVATSPDNNAEVEAYVTTMAFVTGVPPTQGMSLAMLFLALLDYYTPLLAAPLCIAACYMSYTGYQLQQKDGMWPTGLLFAVVIWCIKAGTGTFNQSEKARLGIHFFGKTPGVDLLDFIEDWDMVWPPMMGTVLLMWGVFVRIYIVQKWPEETVGSEFSWQRLYYCVDAIVFYAAVLLWADVSNGWMCVILSLSAALWGFAVKDATVILRFPALFLASFLIFEHYNDLKTGEIAFFASSIACLVVAVGTATVFKPTRSTAGDVGAGSAFSFKEPVVLVDITLLWGILIAFLDGVDGVTKGGLAFGLVLLSLPGLHYRGYPMLLVLTPLLIPLSWLYLLYCLVESGILESGDTRPEFLGAIAGLITSAILIVLSMVQISPASAGDSQEFQSFGFTVTKKDYHKFLLWAGSTWGYVWIVFGFYVTEYTVAFSLVGALSIGIVNLVLGLQDESTLLRITGLAELCVAIFLGAVAPGVDGFAQAVLVLVGSIFALGSGGMYFYWIKRPGTTDEIRPTVSVTQLNLPQAGALPHATSPAELVVPGAPLPGAPPPELELDLSASDVNIPLDSTVGSSSESQGLIATNSAATVAENVSHLTTIDAGVLASSELGLTGPSDILFGALLEASGMRSEQFSAGQLMVLSSRLAAAARSLLCETAQVPQQYTVTAERLSVRVAPSGDASVLRKVGRGAIVSVVSSSHDAARDEEWFELGVLEAVGGEQLLQGGGGWVLAGMEGRTNFLQLTAEREKSE